MSLRSRHRVLARSCCLGGFLVFVLWSAAEQTAAQTAPSSSLSPAPTIAASPIPLDAWLTSASLWQTSPTQFPEARAFRFRWLSNAHDAARSSSRGLRLGGVSVAEVIVRFSA